VKVLIGLLVDVLAGRLCLKAVGAMVWAGHDRSVRNRGMWECDVNMAALVLLDL
jgi:hypothetical protein